MSDFEYLSETKPRARKAHYCILCGELIPQGMRHVARVGKGDGSVYTVRMHEECEALTQEWDESEWEYSEPATFCELLAESRLRAAERGEKEGRK